MALLTAENRYLWKWFRLKKGLCDLRMMQKISYNKRKKRMLNDLIRKLAKAGSTNRTSAIGCSRSSRTHENSQAVFFSLNKAVGQWLTSLLLSTLLTMTSSSLLEKTLKQLSIFCVQHFFNGHIKQLSLVPADDILQMFVCILTSNSLSKIIEFIVFIFLEKLCFMSCFYLLLLQKLEALRRVTATCIFGALCIRRLTTVLISSFHRSTRWFIITGTLGFYCTACE